MEGVCDLYQGNITWQLKIETAIWLSSFLLLLLQAIIQIANMLI